MTILEALRKIIEDITAWAEAKFLSKNNIDSELNATSENPIQNKVVNNEILLLKNLVDGFATEEYVNNALATITITVSKLTTVTLLAANWSGEANPWSQVVTIDGVTPNSKIDLRATALQIVELQDNDIAFIAENDDGVITVYALGSKPETDYVLQAEITEVVVV